MGRLPTGNAAGSSAALDGEKVQSDEGMVTVERLRARVSSLLSRFDVDDKESLAKELAQVVELRASEALAGKVSEILGEQITDSERFQAQILEKVLKDRAPARKSDPFPDDFGSPKYGR